MPKPPRTEATTTAEKNQAIVSPLTDSPAFLVRLAQLRAFDEFHRNFAGLGVTPAGFSVFALIAANPGIRPGIIAEELRMKPSNVAALVNSLVAIELVHRTADSAELRASLLRPSKVGAKRWKEMEAIHRETDDHFAEALTPYERRQLVALLRKLLHR
jgi:DNA-binding MarR family transcriptional regulator